MKSSEMICSVCGERGHNVCGVFIPPASPTQQLEPVRHKLEGMDKLLELLERLVVVAERMESKPPPPVYHTGPMMPPLTITGKPNLTLTGEPKKHFTDSGKD